MDFAITTYFPGVRPQVTLPTNEMFLLLKEDGIVLDEHQSGKRIINIPFAGIAQETFQNKLFANVVAVGALSAVIGIDSDSLNEVISGCIRKYFTGHMPEYSDAIGSHIFRIVYPSLKQKGIKYTFLTFQ